MRPVCVKVAAKVMLTGEYSVLRGGVSLSCTLDRFLEAWYIPNTSSQFRLNSTLWKEPLLFSEGKIQDHPNNPLVKAFFSELPHNASGGELEVKSTICVEDGIGSSSALRLAVLAAVYFAYAPSPETTEASLLSIAQKALELQKSAQGGVASGYDLMNQTVGGFLSFEGNFSSLTRPRNNTITNLQSFLHLFVGGKGAPTAMTTQATATKIFATESSSTHFLKCSNLLGESLLEILENKMGLSAREKFFALLKEHRKFMQLSPFYPHSISEKLLAISGCEKTWSFKTSGAGGEDALLLFGEGELIKEAQSFLETIGWKKLAAQFGNFPLTVRYL